MGLYGTVGLVRSDRGKEEWEVRVCVISYGCGAGGSLRGTGRIPSMKLVGVPAAWTGLAQYPTPISVEGGEQLDWASIRSRLPVGNTVAGWMAG